MENNQDGENAEALRVAQLVNHYEEEAKIDDQEKNLLMHNILIGNKEVIIELKKKPDEGESVSVEEEKQQSERVKQLKINEALFLSRKK